MTNDRFRAEIFLAAFAIAIACGIAPSIAKAQDKPSGSDDGRTHVMRYGSRAAVPSLSQRSRYTELQPSANSIHVTVHYPDAYGYRHAAGLFDAGPNSCDAFSVSVVPTVASPDQPVGIHIEPAMRRASGLYWCDYTASDLPLDVPIDVSVSLGDEPMLRTEAWIGGIEPQPPAGQRRIIGGNAKTIVLSNAAPRAEVVFWMDYAAQPAQLQRLRQPVKRVGPPVPDSRFKQSDDDLPTPENMPEQQIPESGSDQPIHTRAP